MNNKPTSNSFLTRSHRAVVDALWDNMVHSPNPHYGDFRKNTGGYLEGNQWKPIQLLRSSVSKTQNPPNKGYNTKGEVVKADHNNNAFDKSYDFDGIGNRNKTADSLTLPAANNYVSNALNQYSNVNGVARTYDDDGNSLTGVVGTRGQLGEIKWNGNNRLTEVTTADGKLVKVDYDHMGRRFRKSVTTGGETKYTYFVYAGMEAIAKYQKIGGETLELKKSYYWGIDQGGNGDGTGSLLAEVKAGECLFTLFDGNGNITEYLELSGTMAAHFEYSAFGKIQISTGSKAESVDYGFSTRARDKDLGLIYYNYRYLSVVDGRWIDRDPVQEVGGLNLYGLSDNDSINRIDYFGLKFVSVKDFVAEFAEAYQKSYIDGAPLNRSSSIDELGNTIITIKHVALDYRERDPSKDERNGVKIKYHKDEDGCCYAYVFNVNKEAYKSYLKIISYDYYSSAVIKRVYRQFALERSMANILDDMEYEDRWHAYMSSSSNVLSFHDLIRKSPAGSFLTLYNSATGIINTTANNSALEELMEEMVKLDGRPLPRDNKQTRDGGMIFEHDRTETFSHRFAVESCEGINDKEYYIPTSEANIFPNYPEN